MRVSGLLADPSYGPALHAKGKIPLLLDFNPTDQIGIAEVEVNGIVSVELSEEQYRRVKGEGWSFEVSSPGHHLSLVRIKPTAQPAGQPVRPGTATLPSCEECCAVVLSENAQRHQEWHKTLNRNVLVGMF